MHSSSSGSVICLLQSHHTAYDDQHVDHPLFNPESLCRVRCTRRKQPQYRQASWQQLLLLLLLLQASNTHAFTMTMHQSLSTSDLSSSKHTYRHTPANTPPPPSHPQTPTHAPTVAHPSLITKSHCCHTRQAWPVHCTFQTGCSDCHRNYIPNNDKHLCCCDCTYLITGESLIQMRHPACYHVLACKQFLAQADKGHVSTFRARIEYTCSGCKMPHLKATLASAQP